MARKQVELDLGTPALRPTVQRAGQYSVAVQQTPKTNSALQLAQALRVAPQILGQASNIAKDMGAEKAAEVMDVEAALQDDGVKGILGYNKAYQQGLVKRYFVQNEDTIRQRFMNLARTAKSSDGTEEGKMASINEFPATLSAEREQFVAELMNDFGGDPHREQAIQALTSSFVDGVINDTNEAYIKNVTDQSLMMLSANAQKTFEASGATAGLTQLSGELKAYAIDMTPKERATEMRNAVAAHHGVLVAEGKYSDAEAFLEEADKYAIQGAGALFGTTEGKQAMTAMRKSLKNAQGTLEDNLKDLKANVEVANDTVASLFLSSAPFETKQQGMVNALLASKVPQADAEEAIQRLFSDGMSPNDMWQAWNTLTAELSVQGGDLTKALLGSVQDDNLRMTKEGLFAKPVLGITTEAQYNEASTKILEYLLKNPTASLRDIPLGANVPKSDARVIGLFDTHSAAVKWRNDEASQYKFYSDKFTADIGGDKKMGIKYAGEFKALLRNQAQNVWDASGRDMDIFNKQIQAKAEEIKLDLEKESQIDKAINQRIRDYIKSPVDRATAIESGRSKDDPAGPDALRDDLYPLLQADQRPADMNPRAFGEALVEERGRMLNDKYPRELLKGSLLVHGFPTLDSYDENVRGVAGVGFQDFQLGEEIHESLDLAVAAWELDNRTEDQQNAVNFWRRQGYRSASELNDIIRAQISYFQLQY